jgi:hypothetical protein
MATNGKTSLTAIERALLALADLTAIASTYAPAGETAEIEYNWQAVSDVLVSLSVQRYMQASTARADGRAARLRFGKDAEKHGDELMATWGKV